MLGLGVNRAGQGIVLVLRRRPRPRKDVFARDAFELKKGSPAPWLVGRGSRNNPWHRQGPRIGPTTPRCLDRKARRAVAQRVTKIFKHEDEHEHEDDIALRQTARHRLEQRFDRLHRLIPHIRNAETLPFDLPVTAIDLETEFIP